MGQLRVEWIVTVNLLMRPTPGPRSFHINYCPTCYMPFKSLKYQLRATMTQVTRTSTPINRPIRRVCPSVAVFFNRNDFNWSDINHRQFRESGRSIDRCLSDCLINRAIIRTSCIMFTLRFQRRFLGTSHVFHRKCSLVIWVFVLIVPRLSGYGLKFESLQCFLKSSDNKWYMIF